MKEIENRALLSTKFPLMDDTESLSGNLWNVDTVLP